MKYLTLCLSLFVLLSLPFTLNAQTETPTPPPTPDDGGAAIPLVHTVQEGENLTIIAQTYGVTVQELLTLNGLEETGVLAVGQTLIIPGAEGEAVATLYTAQAGDSLAEVAAAFNTTVTAVLNTNRAIHPRQPLSVGQTVSVISRTGSALPQPITGTPHIVAADETLLLVAARYGLSPVALAAANDLPYPTTLYPGQRLRIPSDDPYRYLDGEWLDVQLNPLPVTQGSTLSIYVDNLLPGQPSGSFGGRPLQFVPKEEGYVALVGLDAFTEPGNIPLTLGGSGSRPWRPFRQQVPILSSNYGTQFITVGPELNDLLDPTVRQEEDDFLAPIFTNFSDTQQWEGLFQLPITNTVVSAGYGDARSYNDGPVEIFHTGVDFAAPTGTPVLAPANGTVVFADSLRLRGFVIIIDHGLGVMTAYFHLSEMFVAVGDVVAANQPIAAIGSTGLSSGPHLHWDLRIMNVPVEPLLWTEVPFP